MNGASARSFRHLHGVRMAERMPPGPYPHSGGEGDVNTSNAGTTGRFVPNASVEVKELVATEKDADVGGPRRVRWRGGGLNGFGSGVVAQKLRGVRLFLG